VRRIRAILHAMTGPADPEASAAGALADMVERQLRGRGIADEGVLAAMLAVRRDAFVEPALRALAYADEALPIPAGQTISQPYIVARMTELLALSPGDRVLEVGTGSGYQAAILAALGCRVTTIERHAELAATARERLDRLGFGEMIEVRVGDGSVGAPDEAPWRGILVAAAAPRIPRTLEEQLDPDGGRLVVPVGSKGWQRLMLVIRHGDRWEETDDGSVAFVPLVGEAGFAE
jgi:protein-L-isoaspartate(D-aspartate) O-methyltransferase